LLFLSRSSPLILCGARLVAFVALLARPAVASGEADVLAARLERSGEVFRTLVEASDAQVPATLLARARCVAVIPGVLKGAVIWGGRYGNGVASCRTNRGVWSPPVFIRLAGGNWGFQVGAASADFALFFMSEGGARSLFESQVTLGADASVAAGPIGRTAEAGTDLLLSAEIYSYAQTRGFFLGISFEGAHFSMDRAALAEYYGVDVEPERLLFEGRVEAVPPSAWTFLSALPNTR
jgi:lipid-binding SYLF domain-containing protein